MICECLKFKEQYAVQKKGGGKHPGGKTNPKLDDKRDASTLVLQETFKGIMTQKEAREERKHQEKEEQMKTSFGTQKENLENE